MARTTATEVKQIIDTELADATVDAYIDTASAVVTDELGSSTVLGATRLEEIERWLAAHLIASTRDRMAQQEKLGDAQVTYTGKTGMGLDSTSYGQMVKTLDKTGTLAAMGKQKMRIRAITSFESS